MQLIITNKGKELITKMLDGTSTATFTRVCISDFNYSEENIEELVELKDIKQEILISEVSRVDSSTVEVLVAVNNGKLTESYYVRALGLYAKDSQDREILYGVSVESKSPDYMPAFAGKTMTGISYTIHIKVDNTDQVVLEVNHAAVATTEQVMNIKKELDIHESKSINSQFGAHGLRHVNGVLQRQQGESWINLDYVINSIKTVYLSASRWGTSLPYTQTVEVAGIRKTDAPIIGLAVPDGVTAESVKAQSKGWGYVDKAETSNEAITFYCYNRKPEVDFTVDVKGV